jgi:1,4-dihydroxy-2-naphthoate octaprenyltransferase
MVPNYLFENVIGFEYGFHLFSRSFDFADSRDPAIPGRRKLTKGGNLMEQRSKLSLWFQAIRPFSFTASAVPVLVGSFLAWLEMQAGFNWGVFALVFFAGLIYHAATNVISDYFDYVKGIDTKETRGSSKVLPLGLMTPKQILSGSIVLWLVGIALGLWLVYLRGTPILILGLVGLIGGIFYTAGPIGIKYRALGVPWVFVLMGPLMVLGAYVAQGLLFSWHVIWVSLPIGFLVAAILHANDFRDIEDDSRAGIATASSSAGQKMAAIEYYLLLAGAYISVIFMVAYKVLSPWSLMVFLTAPIALKLVKIIRPNTERSNPALAMVDVQTAQFHFLFGLLLAVSLVINKFVA